MLFFLPPRFPPIASLSTFSFVSFTFSSVGDVEVGLVVVWLVMVEAGRGGGRWCLRVVWGGSGWGEK